MPLPNAKDLGTFVAAKTAVQRAQEINDKYEAERLRMIRAINQAVALVGCLLVMATAYAFVGYPEHRKMELATQESR